MKKVISLVVLVAFLSPSTILAQDADTVRERAEKKIEAAKERMAATKEKITERRCTRGEARIERRISLFEIVREKRANRYTKLKRRMEALITKLEDEDYNTAMLKDHLIEFDAKIDVFQTSFLDHIDQLTGTQEFACGESEGAFMNALNNARAQMKTVRTAAEAVHTYWQTVIKEDLKSLKAQKSSASE
ncbi:hypothetical protein HYW32_01300 [Candidatus Berkelbacteria bacterium]|nr:hypothetical protein [Candidatus Berkelbacteria bacterium]